MGYTIEFEDSCTGFIIEYDNNLEAIKAKFAEIIGNEIKRCIAKNRNFSLESAEPITSDCIMLYKLTIDKDVYYYSINPCY